ncbi:MAG: hypothetical protein AAGA91_00920 [Pseudomonadota bacterium]
MLKLRLLVVSLLAPIALGACQGYDFTVNDRVVYTPDPLFNDYVISDTALAGCVAQAIEDAKVTQAGQLQSLNCSHAGIENLDGLATFGNLAILRLSSNKIRNLVELGQLVVLRELYMEDNRIIDPVPVFDLPLSYLDLKGNPQLQCPGAGKLAHITTVMLPKHCP